MTINGTTQPGYAGTPLIELFGREPRPTACCWRRLGGSTVEGPGHRRFRRRGHRPASGSDLVVGDFLGTDLTGTAAGPGNRRRLIDSADTVGGTAAAAANVIGFGSVGVEFTFATASLVEGNLIGTDASGDHLGNSVGMEFGTSAAGNTLGGTVAGAGNTIAFNTVDAVDALSGTGNAFRGNLIYGNTQASFWARGPTMTRRPRRTWRWPRSPA